MTNNEEEVYKAPDAELERYGEFLLSGEITTESATRLSQAVMRVAHGWKEMAQKPPVVLTIFSTGGSLDAGFHLAATLMRLREMGLEVHTRMQGGVYSTAFVLAQFGTHRLMDSAAIAHIHTIQYAAGGMRPDTVIFEDEADRVAKRKQIMAEVLAYRNTRSAPYNQPDFWIERFMQGREHHLTAQECLEMGLVDEVVGDLGLLNPFQGRLLAPVESQKDEPAA